jgi:hypothetical protein
VATHEDCSEQRKLSRQLASTKQFLESVLDNVPVCVAAKNIEDGRYILPTARSSASRAFPATTSSANGPMRFSVPSTAASIEAADLAALNSPDGQFRNEFVVERGSKKRVLASHRVDRARRQEPAGIPDRAVRRRHRPQVAFPGAGKHQEVSRTGGRQHSGLADRRARQRRTIPARQSQRRDHPQPAARGRHRPDGRRYLQSPEKPS